MICAICQHGQTAPGVTTMTFEREGAVIVVQRVPAEVCTVCGEAYLDAKTTRDVLETAEAAIRDGVRVDVRVYRPAA